MIFLKYLIVFLIPHIIHAVDLSSVELKPLVSGKTSVLGNIPKYYLSDVKLSWDDAFQLCNDTLVLRLLTIQNSYEDTNVQEYLSESGSFSAWTALTDRTSYANNLFIWATTNQYYRYTNFRKGFPNNSVPRGCVSVINSGACGFSGIYTWEKRDCGNLLFAICEIF